MPFAFLPRLDAGTRASVFWGAKPPGRIPGVAFPDGAERDLLESMAVLGQNSHGLRLHRLPRRNALSGSRAAT